MLGLRTRHLRRAPCAWFVEQERRNLIVLEQEYAGERRSNVLFRALLEYFLQTLPHKDARMAWAHNAIMHAVQSGKKRVRPYIGEFQKEGYHHVAPHAIPCVRVSQDGQVAFRIRLPVKSH